MKEINNNKGHISKWPDHISVENIFKNQSKQIIINLIVVVNFKNYK